jgi:DNA polymerase-3 subunit alpha
MAAVMNSEMDNTDKLFIFVEEVALMGMKLLAPNVNTGFSRFRPAGQGQISYGLAAIKGVGETATLAIEEARGQEGAFQSLADFCIRVDSKRVNRRAIENLIRAGALDCLGMNRASLLANLSQALHQADQHQRNQDQGQEDLFGALDLPQTEMTQDLPWTMVREMRTKHRLEHEKQALGFFLSGHPFDEYCDEFRALGFVPLDRLTAAKDKNERTKVVGMVQAIKEMVGKEGNKMAFVALADDRAKLEVAFFGEVYSQVKPHLQMDRLLVVEGHLAPDFRSGDLRMRADQAMDVAGYRERFAKCLAIEVQQPLDAETARALILRLQQGPRGQLPIQVTFVQSEFCVPMKMTSQWLFCPQDSWLEGFDDFSAQVSATLVY